MPFLTETLASIEAQTFRGFTVLAWDDASTDGTLEELRRWIPGRLAGRIISRPGGGLGTMLARMVEEAETELCARIDADDVNVPRRLERQLAVLERNPSIGVLGSQVTRIDAAGREHGRHYKLPQSFDDILHRMLHLWVMWHPTVVFRRHLVLKAGNYKNNAPVEDYDLWMRMAQVTRLENLGECLVKYRVMESTSTEKAIREGRLIPAMDQCFAKNAPQTFGLSEQVAHRLRRRSQPRTVIQLIRALRCLCSQHGGTLLGRMQTASFREALGALTAPGDTLSQLATALLEPGVGAKAKRAREVLANR
jgi:hypothetical protein